MPHSSLYWTQRSVSIISAAAAKRSIAASPKVRRPLCSPFSSSSAKAEELLARSPTPAAVANPFFKNERRLVAAFMLLHISCIQSLLTPELALQKTRQVSEQSNTFVICLLEFDDNA